MKKGVQQVHEKQELTSHNRATQSEYLTGKCQTDYKGVYSVRDIRKRFDTGAEEGFALRNGNSPHYRRSDSVKSCSSDNSVGARGGDSEVCAKTKVSDAVVVNGTISNGSPVNCNDGIFVAEDVAGPQHTPNGSSVTLRRIVDPESAQDRLVKSQSFIEQLQQNLATKLSTATVQIFRTEYSPTLGPRSPSKAEHPQFIDSNQNGKGNNDSHKAVGPNSLTNGNQESFGNNRQTPVPKERVGKGDTSVSGLKRGKLSLLGAIFGSADTRPTRKPADSHKKYCSDLDETADSGQVLNGVAHSVEDEPATQVVIGLRNQHSDDSSPHIIYRTSLKLDVKSTDTVSGETTVKEIERTVQSNNSSSVAGLVDVKNPDCGKLPDESQQQTYIRPKSVAAIPPQKSARVSWTTGLIQKLTEAEEKRKSRSQTKVPKPKHIVRFPQTKDKVSKQNKAKPSEGTKKESEPPLVLQQTSGVSAKLSDTGSDCIEKEIKENPSGVVVDEKSRDAYANLLTQLTDSMKEERQVSEVTGEDLLLKQSKLEELRAAVAREECANTSSDDDSVYSVAITASTGNNEVVMRKEPKPSGIRRLLPHGLFVQKHRHLDRTEEDAALERLLKGSDAARVYPATNTARPVLETAFLSDSSSKLPVRSAVRQQQRPQSSPPAPKQKQASPRSRRHQKDVDQKSIQENEQNSTRINIQTRSKSLSPARDRRSSGTSPTSRRTIPDTSLVLEKRIERLQRALSPPPDIHIRRPSSTPPSVYHKRVPHLQNSSTSYSNRIPQQGRVLQHANAVHSDTPDGAYYHSPPSRRRQQNKDPETDHKTGDKQRKVSGGSSASSSSSTIVAESPPISALSWNPLLLNLENQALSGSPDIRKLQQQQQRQPQHSSNNGQHYGDINRDTRNVTPATYYHPHSGIAREPQRLPEVYHDSSVVQVRSPTSVPSGRLSAPPVSSYHIEDYPRRRVISPEPPRTRREYEHDQLPVRSSSHPPRLWQANQTSSPQRAQQPVLPTDKRLVGPVAVHLHITPQQRPREEEDTSSKETQTSRNYMQQQYRQLGDGLRVATPSRYKRLSRQEVEALYWERQKLRLGLSSQHQHISNAPRQEDRLGSTTSLPQSPTHIVVPSVPSSPLFQQEAVSRQPFRTQSVQNVGSGYAPVLVRPQPMYNTAQQYQLMQQSRASNDSNIRASRARSASPGPNSSRNLSTRSLSLPRSITAPVLPEGLPHKANDDMAEYFKRGVPQRNTIGPIKMASHSPQIRQMSTPTIYEESLQQVGEPKRAVYPDRHKRDTNVDGERGNKGNTFPSSKSQNSVVPVINRSPLLVDANDYKKPVSGKKNKKPLAEDPVQQQPYYPPIFKRGSLITTSASSGDGVESPMSPKRVSFTSRYGSEPPNWPTRKGPAPEPPTRQRIVYSVDSDVFLPDEECYTYANVPEAPNRPLPPVPRDAVSSVYGVILRKSRDTKSPVSAVPVHVQRWQQQSESESGSEAGEVQRILQQGSHVRGTYFRFEGCKA